MLLPLAMQAQTVLTEQQQLEEAQKQFDNAESIVVAIIEYMRKNNSGTII